MHNHLYYTDSYSVQVVSGKIGEPGLFIAEIPYTAPRLYLAADRRNPAARRRFRWDQGRKAASLRLDECHLKIHLFAQQSRHR